jgi:thioredoxin
MTKADFDKLLDTDKKVLIDFYAEWCGPCKKMEPFLNKMTEELKDKVTIIRIDVDKNETLANELKVEFLPTLMVYENKKVTWQGEGYVSEEELRKKL